MRDGTYKPTLIDHDRDISDQSIPFDEVLLICNHIGQLLQGVSEKQRDAAIARLDHEFRNLGNEGVPVAAMMFGQVSSGWKPR